MQVVDAEIAFAALDGADVGTIETGPMGKLLLGDALSLSVGPEPLAECKTPG